MQIEKDKNYFWLLQKHKFVSVLVYQFVVNVRFLVPVSTCRVFASLVANAYFFCGGCLCASSFCAVLTFGCTGRNRRAGSFFLKNICANKSNKINRLCASVSPVNLFVRKQIEKDEKQNWTVGKT